MQVFWRVLSYLALSLALSNLFNSISHYWNILWWMKTCEVASMWFDEEYFVLSYIQTGRHLCNLRWHFNHYLAFPHDHWICWQIRIDGQDVREVTLESLRKSMGVVPQDTVSSIKWFGFCLSNSTLLYI